MEYSISAEGTSFNTLYAYPQSIYRSNRPRYLQYNITGWEGATWMNISVSAVCRPPAICCFRYVHRTFSQIGMTDPAFTAPASGRNQNTGPLHCCQKRFTRCCRNNLLLSIPVYCKLECFSRNPLWISFHTFRPTDFPKQLMPDPFLFQF